MSAQKYIYLVLKAFLIVFFLSVFMSVFLLRWVSGRGFLTAFAAGKTSGLEQATAARLVILLGRFVEEFPSRVRKRLFT